ncbi:type I restriction-modification system subunit M N-terminal domain-containing protein [Citroniella saccharovorans]|uniref:Type I restriction-modification system subunit M N-terminal domain-containing protein n=1 Tax=Citroniella saccharovorans TaxID=2053367 RepID=A0AAW9MX47_9FIRM|nr:type I restriction-modification system subunit M N-terminal domain-containing protein [Citroniella saccharovorans]MEB3429272.1 type I restriction-modification system subunit M N-terminal domain-containing protein [Citroniella saccharovorans]
MTRTQELYQKLWDSADILRSKMDVNEYKSYLLGLIFYKFLSDNMVLKVVDLIGQETEDIDQAKRFLKAI